MRIPSNGQWTQTNQGDIFGTLHETENCTFDKLGKLQLSRKTVSIHDSSENSALAYLMGAVYNGSNYFAITSNGVFTFDLAGGSLTQLSGGPTLGNFSDVVYCYDRVYTTSATAVYYYSSGWSSFGSITTGVPHPLAVFDSLPTYKLAVGNSNKVNLYDSSNNLSSTVLTLPAQYEITTMRYRNGYLYIGTRHKKGGEAMVFLWDGSSSDANSNIPVGSSWVFSMTEYGNTVVIVTDAGQLLEISGLTAKEIAAFPVYYNPDELWIGSGGLAYNGKVFNRGMVSVGSKIFINVDGTTEFGYNPEMKSGIWVYDPSVGLYHRANWALDKVVYDNTLTVSSSTITTSADHNLITGDAVQFVTIGALSGVTTTTKYYVYVVSSTQIKLSHSRKSLKNGQYVTITGTATTGDKLAYVPNTVYRGSATSAAGAICLTTYSKNPLQIFSAPVFWGARVFDKTNSTTIYSFQTFCDSFNIGKFVLQRTDAISWFGRRKQYINIEEAWKKLYIHLRGISLDTESLIVKYKTTEDEGHPTLNMGGTWLTTDTINADISYYDRYAWEDLSVGDEITISAGYGRGYSAHITAINHNSNVYSVTIDESVGTVGGYVAFYAENYKKITTITNARHHANYGEAAPGVQSDWVKFKIEMRGFETEIDHLLNDPVPSTSGV